MTRRLKLTVRTRSPAVVASTPSHPDIVCVEIAQLVKELIRSGKVENENQIAFLFPSLKTDHVSRFRTELEKLDLKVYAPRAGKFIEVEEAVAVFGVFLHIFEKPVRGDFPGSDYRSYFDWIDTTYALARDLIKNDKYLAQFVEDRKSELTRAVVDYQALMKTVTHHRWQPEGPYDIPTMKRALLETPGLSDVGKRNLLSRYFESVVITVSTVESPCCMVT